MLHHLQGNDTGPRSSGKERKEDLREGMKETFRKDERVPISILDNLRSREVGRKQDQEE